MRIVFESPMAATAVTAPAVDDPAVPFFDDGNLLGRFAADDVKIIVWPFGDVGGDFNNLRLLKLLLLLLLLLIMSMGGRTRFKSLEFGDTIW